MTEPAPPPDVTPWRRQSQREGESLRLFRIRHDRLEHPRTDHTLDALVLETPDWANVVALTPQRELVLVRQYRFGVREATTEIPGGMVDAGEEPRIAAARELVEETGYTSSRWTDLGAVQPNPAFHDNLCHHFLAEECERTSDQALDAGEDVEVFLRPVDDVLQWIRSGEIRNSLVVAALARVFDLRG